MYEEIGLEVFIRRDKRRVPPITPPRECQHVWPKRDYINCRLTAGGEREKDAPALIGKDAKECKSPLNLQK